MNKVGGREQAGCEQISGNEQVGCKQVGEKEQLGVNRWSVGGIGCV